MSPSPKAPQSTAMKIALFLALVAVASTAMYSTMPVITVEAVALRLQQVANYISSDAANAGRQGALKYGDIKILGWGYDKYATVDDVTLTLTTRTPEGSREWSVMAPLGNVRLDPLHSRRQIFRFSEPLKLMENGTTKATISFASPLRFGFLGGLESKQQSMLITVRLISPITITPEPSGEGEPVKPVVITYEGYPEVNIRNLPATDEREAKFEFRNVLIENGSAAKMTIGVIANDIYESANQDKRVEGKYTLTISDFANHGNDGAVPACSLTSNLDYVSDVSLMTVLGVPATGNIEMKVNKLVFACEDFGVKINGNLTRKEDDALPIGLLNVSIENVKAFLASSLISEKTRSELTAALPKITGQPLDSLTSAKIQVKREKNGALYVGNVTSDEAGISLIADLMQAIRNAHPAAAVPTAAGASAKTETSEEGKANGQ